MSEIWDAYDRKEQRLGFDLVREEKIPDGAYHLVSETIIRHEDGTFLLMQRDWKKKLFPGAWEGGSGGSALKGETPDIAAKREVQEETGIAVKNLKELYIIVSDKHQAIYHGYLSVTDCQKDSITLQEGETIDYKWVSKKEFIDFFDSDEFIGNQKVRMKGFVDSIRGN